MNKNAITPSQIEQLKKASKRSGIPIDDLIRIAVAEFLQKEDEELESKGISHSKTIAELRRMEMTRLGMGTFFREAGQNTGLKKPNVGKLSLEEAPLTALPFEDLISKTDTAFGARLPNEEASRRIPDKVWLENAAALNKSLTGIFSALFRVAQNILGKDICNGSLVESYLAPPHMGYTGLVRFRPIDNYYSDTYSILPVPSPKNPLGFDAAGLTCEMMLLPGLTLDTFVPSRVLMQLHIWGASEREAFKIFNGRHNKTIGQLLSLGGMRNFQFITSCCFDRIDTYKGGDISHLLNLYFKKDDDDENSLMIERLFNIDARLGDVISNFVILTALYDAAYYFCTNKELSYSRIESHLTRLTEFLGNRH